jgi:hypothetical protein
MFHHTSEAAEATAKAGGWFNKTSAGDTQSWRFFNPTTSDTIMWTSGPDTIGTTTIPMRTDGPEQKFLIVPLPGGGTGIVPHGFAGFSYTDGPISPGTSTVTTTGSGSSSSVSGRFTTTISYFAEWKVTANGTGPSWTAKSTGNDPFLIHPSDFAGITGPNYDLFFTASLESGNYSPNGAIEMDVSYNTALGNTTLLDIMLDGNGAHVNGGDLSYLSIFQLTDPSEGPTLLPDEKRSPSMIKFLLDSYAASRNINSPLYLGFFLDDIPVPTTLLNDGSVANISVRSQVSDANVSEPSTFMIISSSILCLLAYLRRIQASVHRD